jgi:hypothetical protein
MNLFWAISSCLLVAACAPAPKPDPERAALAHDTTPVTIDFQTGFENTSVKLTLNGRPVFDGVLTTDDRIGLAHSLEYSGALRSPVEAEFIVAGRSAHRFRIDLREGRYIGFREDLDSGEILMEISREAFLYD